MNPGADIARNGNRGGSRRRVARALALVAREDGASLVELGLMLPFLGLLLIGVIDFGRAYYLSIEVASAAHTGALYGVQNPKDTAGMQNAATGDAPNVSGIAATATYGCECSDGSNAVANCTRAPTCGVNAVNYVQVTTSATYHTMFPWPGIPTALALWGSAKLRAGQ